MMKQEMISMILAGGQGSRLKEMTKAIAKPAVPFGGRYRIIDFALSNCTNSGIDTIGVLTQYRPFQLNAHIGVGAPWDLNHSKGGISMLPPHATENDAEWYRGTAHAIYQNIEFIDQYQPEHVLILSGDHIYKMNYDKMLQFHKKKDADCTIATLEVPWEEASRFGILNTDADYNIEEFDEKPENPRSNLASMGIYIFKWSVLREYLVMMEAANMPSDDFGHDVLPKMLADGKTMSAYPFKGYWKDVGTLNSYWEANLDMICPKHELNLHDRSWIVYSQSFDYPPQNITQTGNVKHSTVVDGCKVSGTVNKSVLFPGVIIEEGAIVEESVLMANVHVKKGAIVRKAIIMENTEVPSYAQVIGDEEEVTLYFGEGK
ncbi:MAG: glucose-1-phosphate adenylyltransferase [Culicoidibacterales bacterium]